MSVPTVAAVSKPVAPTTGGTIKLVIWKPLPFVPKPTFSIQTRFASKPVVCKPVPIQTQVVKELAVWKPDWCVPMAVVPFPTSAVTAVVPVQTFFFFTEPVISKCVSYKISVGLKFGQRMTMVISTLDRILSFDENDRVKCHALSMYQWCFRCNPFYCERSVWTALHRLSVLKQLLKLTPTSEYFRGALEDRKDQALCQPWYINNESIGDVLDAARYTIPAFEHVVASIAQAMVWTATQYTKNVGELEIQSTDAATSEQAPVTRLSRKRICEVSVESATDNPVQSYSKRARLGSSQPENGWGTCLIPAQRVVKRVFEATQSEQDDMHCGFAFSSIPAQCATKRTRLGFDQKSRGTFHIPDHSSSPRVVAPTQPGNDLGTLFAHTVTHRVFGSPQSEPENLRPVCAWFRRGSDHVAVSTPPASHPVWGLAQPKSSDSIHSFAFCRFGIDPTISPGFLCPSMETVWKQSMVWAFKKYGKHYIDLSFYLDFMAY